MERVEFLTEDSVSIVGTWNRIDAPNAWAALLLHMMPADRKSWEDFSAVLARKGMHTLAIDLRGHGESNRRGAETLSSETFTDQQHQASILDLAAAHAWLITQDIPADHVILIGASIGANLALEYLSTHPRMKMGILLSPGLDYRGVKTDEAVRKLQPDQSLLFVSSRSDQEAAKSVEELDRLAPNEHDIIWVNGAAHGTDLLRNDLFLSDQITGWIESHL